MRIIYMYHEHEPVHASVVPGSLPSPSAAFKGYIPLSLTQRSHDELRNSANVNKGNGKSLINTMQLRMEDVALPDAGDDPVQWCKIFEMLNLPQKHHLIKVRVRGGVDFV